MTSKEMEARSGVPRANIRYYEAEGLLDPERSKNGYRNYSEADLAQLERVRLLRRLGVSLEDLKALSAGTAELGAVLEKRLGAVGDQRATLDRVEQVCSRLCRERAAFSDLDAGPYLADLDAPALPETAGAAVPPLPPVPLADALPTCTSAPRRLFARWLDEIWMMILMLSVSLLAGSTALLRSRLGAGILMQALLFAAEPLLIAFFGTTPGKALMGLHLKNREGGRLTLAEAYERHLWMLWYGRGLYLPIWSWVCLYRSAKRCMDGEPQPWDEQVAYTARPWHWQYAAAWVGSAAAVLAAGLLAATVSQFPPHRGDLTVAQFAENFNRQARYLDMQFSAGELDGEGRWQGRSDALIVVDIGGWPGGLPDFTYTVENGVVTAVTMEGRAEDVQGILTLPTDAMAAAVTAFTWARREAPFFEKERAAVLANLSGHTADGCVIHQAGTVITLTLRTEGLHRQGSWLLPDSGADHNACAFAFTVALEESGKKEALREKDLPERLFKGCPAVCDAVSTFTALFAQGSFVSISERAVFDQVGHQLLHVVSCKEQRRCKLHGAKVDSAVLHQGATLLSQIAEQVVFSGSLPADGPVVGEMQGSLAWAHSQEPI
ncbi:MAG: MerR family transcriptional regulator [Oscillibacter sp.]|nr:MerR family transcriptional regulator [Oscillibacter sp.]